MESRSIVEWTTDDFPSVLELAERVSNYVEANEPGTLVFEWIGDESTGKVIWYQVFASDGAFLTHAKNMTEAGFRTQARQVLTQDRLLLLTPPTDPQTQAMAQQAGAEQVVPIGGIVRYLQWRT